VKADYYRFEKAFRPEGKPRSYTGTYFVKDLGGMLFSSCDTFGHCLKAPTVFRASYDDQSIQFVMEARGRILNRTFDLRRTRSVAPFAIIQGDREQGWEVASPAGHRIVRILDAQRWKKRLLFRSGVGTPERYVVLRGALPIAVIRRGLPLRSLTGQKTRKIKLLEHRSNWVVAFEPESSMEVDHRLLWAVTVLLNEVKARDMKQAG
jgi:hypothetical protein